MVVTVPDVPSRCMWAFSQPSVLGHEAVDEGRDLGDHRRVNPRRHVVPAVALGERHHAERQRHPGPDRRQRRAAPAWRRAFETNQLGGAAADVEQDHGVGLRIDQRGTAGRRQSRLGLAIDDLELEPDLLGDACDGTRRRSRRRGTPRWRSGARA